MSTKEQISAALKNKFRRKEIPLADGVSVTVREMSRDEHKALNSRLFLCVDGEPAADKEGMITFQNGAKLIEEWLSATLEPSYTVDELLGNDWPASLKAMLYKEARSVNTSSLEDAAKNS